MENFGLTSRALQPPPPPQYIAYLITTYETQIPEHYPTFTIIIFKKCHLDTAVY